MSRYPEPRRSSEEADLLSRVEYRLAETPRTGKRSIACVTAPIDGKRRTTVRTRTRQRQLRRDAEPGSSASISTVCSPVRSASACRRPAYRSPLVRSVRRSARPRGRERQDHRRSEALRRRSRRGQAFPELPYLTVRLGYVACDHFDADIGMRPCATSTRPFIAACSCTSLCPPRPYPGLTKPMALMAALPGGARADFPALSVSSVQAIRAADAVRAQRRAFRRRMRSRPSTAGD